MAQSVSPLSQFYFVSIMTVFLQYTICDPRILFKNRNQLLDKPNWNNPQPIIDFVCGSGQIIKRKGRGLNNWIGEDRICKINKGIWTAREITVLEKLRFKCVSKHYYCNGKFLHKYEFVFHLQNGFKGIHLSAEDLIKITRSILANEIKIRNKEYGYDISPIGKAFKKLKAFHINCTTKNEFLSTEDDEDIEICIPQIFFKLDPNDSFQDYASIAIKASEALKNKPIDLYGWVADINNYSYRIWVLKELKKSKYSKVARSVRISCMRIHSEVECIKIICQLMLNDRIKKRSFESHQIQYFLNSSTRKISQKKKRIKALSGIDDIDKYTKQVISMLEPGAVSTILENIEELQIRLNVKAKTTKVFEFHPKFIEIYQTHYGDGDNVANDKITNLT